MLYKYKTTYIEYIRSLHLFKLEKEIERIEQKKDNLKDQEIIIDKDLKKEVELTEGNDEQIIKYWRNYVK